MTKRREFPASVKVAVIKRATRDGVTYCEKCGALAKRWQVDHINPDGLTGKPVIENAQLLGECCYAPKNAKDTRDIAQAKRREAKHMGAHRPRQKIASNPDALKAPPKPARIDKSALAPLPRRSIYRDM